MREDSFLVDPTARILGGVSSSEKSNFSMRMDPPDRRSKVESISHLDQTRVAGKTGPTCEEFHCNVGGRCVQDFKSGSGRCQCPLGTHGIYCERGSIPLHYLFIDAIEHSIN